MKTTGGTVDVVADQHTWRQEAEHRLRGKDWTGAVELLRPRLEAVPVDAQAWVFLGEALEQLGDRGSAWACYERGWILDPPAAWAGRVFARVGDGRDQPITDWVQRLLTVPAVRVMGAILAKDEADNITRCIEALRPAVDGVVVVDTGSSDETVALAQAAGATVVQTTWMDDFGAARQAAEPALGETGWVLWVDADEFLQAEDVAVPRVVAGLFDQADPPMLLRFVQMNHLGDRVEANYDTTRMFPLGRGITWVGRIHEQVVRRSGPGPIQRASVRIRVDHWGYDHPVVEARQKYERNIRLLKAWAADEPNRTAVWGFLGRDLFIAGRVEEAVEALYRAESLASQDPTYARTVEVRTVLCEALVRLNRLEEARVVAERAVQGDPTHPAGWYWRAQVALLQANDRMTVALESAQKAQATAPQYRGIVTVSQEMVNFLAPVAEADALKMQGRWPEALATYRRALQVKPDHVGVRRQIQAIEENATAVAAARADQSEQSRQV